jgi:hypothetical protein
MGPGGNASSGGGLAKPSLSSLSELRSGTSGGGCGARYVGYCVDREENDEVERE